MQLCASFLLLICTGALGVTKSTTLFVIGYYNYYMPCAICYWLLLHQGLGPLHQGYGPLDVGKSLYICPFRGKYSLF